MKTNKFLIIYKTFIFLFFVFPVFLCAQQQPDASAQDIKVKAANAFKNAKYEEALGFYETLLKRYPRDGEFNYYTGLCLYKLDRDFKRAVELLSFAAIKPDVPANAFYYVGRIYMQFYQFSEAKSSFEKFLDSATKHELKSFDAALQLQHVNNAIKLTRQYNLYETIVSSKFSFDDASSIDNIISNSGKLQIKSPELMTSGEKRGDLTTYFFVPVNIKSGEYIYISGYGKGKKNGADLFKVKYIDGKKWGPMVPLATLNTPFDEILPYFDPLGKDLYFASSGQNSMGGFDIFKSHYDEKRNSWSKPLNQGFPVNSPFDEYLYIPLTEPGSILLVTNREKTDKFSVYRLNISEEKQISDSFVPEEIKNIANFKQSIPGVFTDLDKPDQSNNEKDTIKTVDKLPPLKENKTDNEQFSYNIVLKEALVWQFKADSISKLSRETKMKIREVTEPDIRLNFQRAIEEWDRKTDEYQEKANENYRLIKEMEAEKKNTKISASDIGSKFLIKKDGMEDSGGENRKAPVFPSPVENKKTLTTVPPHLDITTQVNKSEKIITHEDKSFPESQPEKEKSSTNMDNYVSSFTVLDKSPYSADNPFPFDNPAQEGPYYSIQLAVFSQNIKYDTFGGFFPIIAEKIPDKNMTRYYTGKFTKRDEAVKALEIVKKAGYSDAFMVAWFNGQKLPPAKVYELEKRE